MISPGTNEQHGDFLNVFHNTPFHSFIIGRGGSKPDQDSSLNLLKYSSPAMDCLSWYVDPIAAAGFRQVEGIRGFDLTFEDPTIGLDDLLRGEVAGEAAD